jgi:hypothetical protein
MFSQYDIPGIQKQTPEKESQSWAGELENYLTPYSQRLDAYLDRRVVGNLTAVVAGIVQTRAELTTSALGSAITGPGHAEAGTQRLQRALHHEGWKAGVIEEEFWGASGAAAPGVGEPRRDEARHLGQQCAGEAGERAPRRIGSRAFQSGASAGPQPQRRVQSARWHESRACVGLNGKACCWSATRVGRRW